MAKFMAYSSLIALHFVPMWLAVSVVAELTPLPVWLMILASSALSIEIIHRIGQAFTKKLGLDG